MPVRDANLVRNEAISIALGIKPDGTKQVLGLWIEQIKAAKSWMRGMSEPKTRGSVDGRSAGRDPK